jgi:antitoxin component YwqK of YwqJK toxin-antitoxin module
MNKIIISMIICLYGALSISPSKHNVVINENKIAQDTLRKEIKYYKHGGIRNISYVNSMHQLDSIYISYYENGNIRYIISLSNGKKDGDVFFYYENGTLQSKRLYKNDKPYGTHFFYNEEGALIEQIDY